LLALQPPGSHGLEFPFPTPESWASHFPLPIKEAPANFVQVVFEAVDSFVMKKKFGNNKNNPCYIG
jgi:hypothetical protein